MNSAVNKLKNMPTQCKAILYVNSAATTTTASTQEGQATTSSAARATVGKMLPAAVDCCTEQCCSTGPICTDISCTTPACCSSSVMPSLACCGGSFNLKESTQAKTPPPLPPLLPLPPRRQTQSHANDVQVIENTQQQRDYVYEEPAENFISIDDAKIKSLLHDIGQQKTGTQESTHNRKKFINAHVVYEVIDLDSEEEQQKLQSLRRKAQREADGPHPSRPVQCTVKALDLQLKQPGRKSPDISLIPKEQDARPEQRIVAEIDLIDSDSSEDEVETVHDDFDDGDDETALSLSAVSCELQIDETENSNDAAEGEGETEAVATKLAGESPWLSSSILKRKRFAMFECNICGKQVQSNYNLRRHMMIHTGERPFGCDLCDRRFREFSDLKKHRKRHADEVQYLCMICRCAAPSEYDSTRCESCESKCLILKPEKLATKANQIVAQYVAEAKLKNATQQTAVELTKKSRVDINATAVNEVAAPKPTQIFLTPTLTLTPIPAPAPVPATPTNNKYLSGRQLTETLLLLEHIPAVHRPIVGAGIQDIIRKEFPCPICQRAFGSRHNLKRHFMIHTGEKPYSCDKCNKPFREHSILKKHMLTHQRDRWYKCIRCTQKFRDYMLYMQHKKLHDELEGETQAIDSNEDSEEDAMSLEEDTLECYECGEYFTDIEVYTKHIKQHDNGGGVERRVRYKCYICEASFEQCQALERHLTWVHKISVNVVIAEE